MDAYLAGLEKAQAAGIDLTDFHGRLPRGPKGREGGPGPLHDPLGGLLLRVPGGHRDRQAAREDRAPTRPRRSRARPRSPTPGSPTRRTRRSSPPSPLGRPDGAGANKQRPLWASTGVKDPAYKDTLYVDDLVAPGTVNTMPEATLDATADHGEITGDTVAGGYDQARADLDAVEALGISYDDVVQLLEDEGVEKFEAAWNDLLDRRASLSRKGVDGE